MIYEVSIFNFFLGGKPSKNENKISISIECACLNVHKSHEVLHNEESFTLEIQFILVEVLLLHLLDVELFPDVFLPVVLGSDITIHHRYDGVI